METKYAKVLITGSNKGIGRAMAKRLAEDQCDLFLTMRKNEPDIAMELKNLGARSVEIFELDLSEKKHIDSFLLQNKNLEIDILFNNAGVLTGGLLELQPIQDIYQMLQVNVNALIHLTHGFLPRMVKRKKGKIINHSSVTAFMHFPCASTYAASKAAVAAFTDCLKAELENTGVSTLTLVTPGIKTQMADHIEKLYSKNFDIPSTNISASKYADMIREAILEDLEILQPSGVTGIGLKIAKYLTPLFDLEVKRRFKGR